MTSAQHEQKDDEMAKKITPRSEDYSRWYSDVIAAADMAEHAPVRGCMIIKPNGYAIWENMKDQLDKMIKAKGVENAYFPLFIPESFLNKEADHIEGFSPELAIVTHAGGKKLEEPLVVRPTSETIIYDSFAKWIQSYRDLPLAINQWANVVRWEKRPRLFLRTSEFLWQEGHTAHATAQEAEDYAIMILHDIYERFVEDYLAIPTYCGQKSESEKFAGALNTYCFETLTQDGKSLQAGTSHDLSDHFSKTFDVTFLDNEGNKQYVYQTSWGVSTRLIGGLIMAHSDDKGLVLPPRIAPTQIVIIPICKTDDDAVMLEAKKIKDTLAKTHTIKLDPRIHLRPGEKYYDWERRGIPIRIELGPKDLANNSCVLARRDTGEKQSCLITDLETKIPELLNNIQESLFNAALERREKSNTKVDSWEDFKKGIERGGYIFAHWCGEKDCEAEIKEKTKCVSRCLPFDGETEAGEHVCVHCGKKANGKRWIFAKAY